MSKTKWLAGGGIIVALSIISVIFINSGNQNLVEFTLDNGKVYQCDFTAWGNCSMNGDSLNCDSRYDGNANGICESGESCIRLNLSDTNFKKIKSSYKELRQFDVECKKIK